MQTWITKTEHKSRQNTVSVLISCRGSYLAQLLVVWPQLQPSASSHTQLDVGNFLITHGNRQLDLLWAVRQFLHCNGSSLAERMPDLHSENGVNGQMLGGQHLRRPGVRISRGTSTFCSVRIILSLFSNPKKFLSDFLLTKSSETKNDVHVLLIICEENEQGPFTANTNCQRCTIWLSKSISILLNRAPNIGLWSFLGRKKNTPLSPLSAESLRTASKTWRRKL